MLKPGLKIRAGIAVVFAAVMAATAAHAQQAGGNANGGGGTGAEGGSGGSDSAGIYELLHTASRSPNDRWSRRRAARVPPTREGPCVYNSALIGPYARTPACDNLR